MDLGYVITGLGRSGTTFLAHVFKNAGYDLGDVNTEEIGVNGPTGGGMEHEEFTRVNMRLQSCIRSLWTSENTKESKPPSIEEMLIIGRPMFNQKWPFVLKDPRFCDTSWIWHAAGYRPKHLFLCMRNPYERIASVQEMTKLKTVEEQHHIALIQKTYYQYFSVYSTQLLCLENDIPLTLVHYPRIGKDKEYAEKILSPFIKNPWSIVSGVWKSTMHHQQSDMKLYQPHLPKDGIA